MAALHHDPELLLAQDGFLRRLAHGLVADAARADDLVQDAWLSALRARSRPRRLRAWLAGAVRRLTARAHRDAARRDRREQRAAKAEAIPSPADIVERENARRAVVDAVLALDEPARTTLILRYFDDLPPRRVAERLGVPVETVRTRIKRALERLRARMDDEHGGERTRWCVPLIGVAGWQQGAVTAGVIAMSTTKKVAGAAALVLLALGGASAWWLASLASESSSARETAALPALAPPAPVVRMDEPLTSASLPARNVVTASPAATTGSLRVRVVWGDDRTPAADVGVRLVQWGEPDLGLLRSDRLARTDQHGAARFDDLGLDTGVVYGDRGGSTQVAIRAGEESVAELVIPPGVRVEGTVVDGRDAPVPGAVIEVSDSECATVVAKAAADGSFAVRSVEAGAMIGARADGFGPSLRLSVRGDTGPTARVRLVLQTACSLGGVVLGADGGPIAGATVLLGEERGLMQWLVNGESACSAPALRLTTDREGRFETRSVEPGPVRLQAMAPGHAWATLFARAAPSVSESVTIRLQRGLTLRGRVTEDGGRAMAGACVRVARRHWDFGRVETRTAADGTFVLEHLARHDFVASVMTRDRRRAEQPMADLPLGDEVRWDPVLVAAPRLLGRVIDEAGAPLRGWYLAATEQVGINDVPRGNATTKADGRFIVDPCRAASVTLTVTEPVGGSRFPALTLTDVRPGGPEIEVRVPAAARATAHVTGRFATEDGTGIGGARVTFWRRGLRTGFNFTTEGDGSVRVGPIAAGHYTLDMFHADWPQLRGFAERDLRAGETWDLGLVRLPAPGTLVVELPAAWKADFDALRILDLPHPSSQLTVQGDRARSRALAPGEYRLEVLSHRFAYAIVPFTVRRAEVTRLAPALERGVSRMLEIVAPADVATAAAEGWQLAVHRADGRLVHQTRIQRNGSEPLHVSLRLAPGPHRLVLVGADGRRCEAALDVSDAPDDARPVRVVFR